MLRSCVLTRLVVRLSTRKFCTHNRNNDIYVKTLRASRELDQIWNLVSIHRQHMESTHVFETLRTICNIVLSPDADFTPSTIEKNKLIENEYFNQLCHLATSSVRKMNIYELTKLLAILQQLSLPVESSLFTELLASIRDKLEYIHLDEMTELQTLLTKLSKSLDPPNVTVESILIALKLFSKSRATKNGSTSDIRSLVSLFIQSVAKRRSEPFLLKQIQSLYDRKEELNFQQRKDILSIIIRKKSFLLFNQNNIATPMANYCIETLAGEIDKISPEEIIQVFRSGLAPTKLAYNEIWFNKAVEIYKKNCESESICELERALTILDAHSHIDLDLLKIYERRVLGRTFDSNGWKFDPVTAIMRFTAVTNYEPSSGWDPWINALNRAECEVNHLSFDALLRVVSSLAMVGKESKPFTNELIHRIDGFLAREVVRMPTRSILRLFDLNTALHQRKDLSLESLDLREKLVPLVDREISFLTSKKHPDLYQELSNVLSVPLGGEEFVLPLVWTREGIRIHNLTIFRKGNYAAKVRPSENCQGPLFINDIKRPSGAILLSVLPLTNAQVTRHGLIRRSFDLRVRAIEQLAIRVVGVHMAKFLALEARERTPFLMSLIKSKLDESPEDTVESFQLLE